MLFNPFAWSFRTQYVIGFLVCAALMAYALFVEYQLKVEPCPLCVFQRIALMVMGVGFLLGALHNPKTWGRKLYATFILLAGLVGISVAGRHLWLQSLPADQVPACGPGLTYMLDAFPFSKVLKMVFTGSGECAVVNWAFLGLSMPGWVLICYVVLSAGAFWAARSNNYR